MTFKRDNTKNKRLYYQVFVAVELMILVGLFYFGIHWAILLFATPVILLDAWSNLRCAGRQKKFIKEINIDREGIRCLLANGSTESIPLAKSLYSIREKKFEKDRTEIEIRRKKLLRSSLIGRLHIKHWKQILEIKQALVDHNVTQITYRPEGYWAKYGTLTADIVITGTALGVGELADMAGDMSTASDLRQINMPIHEVKDSINDASRSRTERKNTDDQRDELLGKWTNWAGDDAGLAMVWGFGIEFKENGQGFDIGWGTEEENNWNDLFHWKRLADNKIAITLSEASNSKEATIVFQISDHTGGYDGKYLKIVETDKKGFWDYHQPLYKAV